MINDETFKALSKAIADAFNKGLPKTLKGKARKKSIKGNMKMGDDLGNAIKDFLLSVVHEVWHAVQAKKNGGGRKFAEKYEKEISVFQAENPSKENDWYKYNKYEIESEKIAQKDYRRWKKDLDHLKNKNDKVR